MSDVFENSPGSGPEPESGSPSGRSQHPASGSPYGGWSPPPSGAPGPGWSPPAGAWPPPPSAGPPPPPPPPSGGPADAGSPWGSVPPGGSWTDAYPPGEGAPPPPRRGHSRGVIAIAAVAALIAGLVGAAIGDNLANRGTAPVRVADTPSFLAPQGNSGSSQGNGDSSLASSISAKVDPAVVDINTQLGYQQARAAGTGMVLTSSGEVLTNNHVVDGATSITVTVVGTGRTYTANVVGTDPTDDVAVIQLQGASGLKTVKTGDSLKVSAGDSVVAIGNAGGTGGTPSAVSGTVQAVNQSITAGDANGGSSEQLTGLIEMNAPIQPGDSGGPLVNTNGQVIGMNTAASSGGSFQSSATDGFAIPINHALSIARQIESGQSSSSVHIGGRGFLGVQVQSGTSSQGGGSSGDSGGFGSPSTGDGSGAVIAGVVSGSPAAKAGLQQGDEITSVNGRTVDSPDSLTNLLQNHRPGDKVTIGWTDQSGQNHTATVTLTTGPAD
jgi:S1-C subfamily serine protease